MSRYIDADKAEITYSSKDVDKVAELFNELLDAQPTADVVEVVRCKDCKYRSKEWYRDKRYKDGGYWIVGCDNDEIAERVYGLAQDNDFCSYGERRNEV